MMKHAKFFELLEVTAIVTLGTFGVVSPYIGMAYLGAMKYFEYRYGITNPSSVKYFYEKYQMAEAKKSFDIFPIDEPHLKAVVLRYMYPDDNIMRRFSSEILDKSPTEILNKAFEIHGHSTVSNTLHQFLSREKIIDCFKRFLTMRDDIIGAQLAPIQVNDLSEHERKEILGLFVEKKPNFEGMKNYIESFSISLDISELFDVSIAQFNERRKAFNTANPQHIGIFDDDCIAYIKEKISPIIEVCHEKKSLTQMVDNVETKKKVNKL